MARGVRRDGLACLITGVLAGGLVACGGADGEPQATRTPAPDPPSGGGAAMTLGYLAIDPAAPDSGRQWVTASRDRQLGSLRAHQEFWGDCSGAASIAQMIDRTYAAVASDAAIARMSLAEVLRANCG